MASNYVTVLNKIIYFLLFITVTGSSKLNVPHVLLPIFSNINVNFTLEAVNGGCYRWSTTRIDLVHLTMVDPDPNQHCSQKAVVSAISKERSRKVAVVLAEEVNGQFVLRVDVIVDFIKTLTISSTTKEIIMDEVPEIFKVIAFDNQGNQFTTLEGVEFDWKIVCLGSQKDLTVLRFMTFNESPYETPTSIATFEEQNKRGHIVLLAGIKTGGAKVEVALPYGEYSKVNHYEVNLSVVANLIIIPADVYCMAFDMIKFRIFSINNGKMEEIEIPNAQYYLDVEDKSIASADMRTGEITTLKEGLTRVILYDRNMGQNDPSIKLPASSINVVQPTYMTLSLMPYNNWEILLSDHHDILVEVYSSDDHKLYLGPTVALHTQVGEAFLIQQRSSNGSWLTGWAHNEGVAPVQAVLEGIIHPRLGKSKMVPLTAAQDIIIFPRIVLSPSEVILPWDPIARPKYTVPIYASGGDGKFLWSSSNHSVGMVNQQGKVRSHYYGYFEVSAAMLRNHNNRETAKFHILPPSRLEIVEYVNEAEVGSPIFLHIALYAERTEPNGEISHVPFTHCQELPFKVKSSDASFLENKTTIISPLGVSCANVAIIGQNVATSKITVTYHKEGRFLEDSVTVSTYKTLSLLYPKDEIVLAVGTTKQLVFTGGPKPSVVRSDSFIRSVKSDDDDIVEAFDTTNIETITDHADYTVVRVLCKRVGEVDVTLSISNKPMVPNCKNPAASVTAKVICAKPKTIALQPDIKIADVTSCPMDLTSERVIVQSRQDVELDVIVRDENGYRFLNISSLKIDWNVSPDSVALIRVKDRSIFRDKKEGTINFGDTSYQVIVPRVESGEIIVKAKLSGYLQDVLNAHKLRADFAEFTDQKDSPIDLPTIEAIVTLFLVDDSTLSQNELVLYNHPANKRTISIDQGSGFYKLALSRDDVADVTYNAARGEIEIVPQSDGELKVQLIDLCLKSKPNTISVTVTSVHIVRVEMSDKVEIGKCIACLVKLYDVNDNLLTLPNLDMINLAIEMETDIAVAKRMNPDPKTPWGDGEVHYIVTGHTLGDTKVVVNVVGGDQPVSSAPLDLQVFHPLVLYPRNATLLIGSAIQYYNKGGPRPESNIEYGVDSSTIAELDEGGILTARTLGKTKVNARAVGVNPTTGQKLIYGQDDAEVSVIPITGIKIAAPLTRFKVKSTVPVWATGLPEQLSPLILGTSEEPFIYSWSVDDPQIVQIVGPFETIGIVYEPKDQIVKRIIGLEPGRTKLRLSVSVPATAANCGKNKQVTYTDIIDIEVFEGLLLTEPRGISSKSVLMAPHSNIQIKTNMDATSKIAYRLIGEESAESISQRSLTIPNPLVTVTQDGLLESHGNIGYSMVLIMSTDEHGLKQTLSLIVEVKPIYYMMLNVASHWEMLPNTQNMVLPLGTEIEITATYHDNSGNEFTAGSAQLKMRTSRFDLAKITPGRNNSTLIVSLRKPGVTVLKVWSDSLRRTADYIKLNVQQAVIPVLGDIVTGDVLCLWSPVTAPIKGRWTTSDINLFSIDSDTGIGIAVATRSGSVAVSHNLHPAASLQLRVLPISQIVLLMPASSQILTNAASIKPFEVPLIIQSDSITTKQNNLYMSWQCQDAIGNVIKAYPFFCNIQFTNSSIEIDALSIFDIRSSFNPTTGLYTCTIVPKLIKDPNISVLESNVIVTARSASNDVVSEPLEVTFHPSVYFDNELVLDDDSYSATLLVTGTNLVLNKVSITPADPNLLSVSDGVRTTENTLKYDVRLLDYHWKLKEFDEPLTLHLHSEATDEHMRIYVKILSPDRFTRHECATGGRSPFATFLYDQRHILIVVTSMCLIFFVTFYVYSIYIHPVIQVNFTPNQSITGTALHDTSLRNNRSPVTYTGPNQTMLSPSCVGQGRGIPTRSPGAYGSNLNASYGSREPVYGDPNSFYSTSPEVRRNRRLM